MKAVAYTTQLPTNEDFLIDVELDKPTAPEDHDILVKVEAVSVNPVDTKVRQRVDPEGAPKVLGFDASGVVEAVGANVTSFKPGDKVFYAGAIDRSGSNAEYQIVDERIVGKMPSNLDFAAAAAMPLTAITAYEALFDRLPIKKDTIDRNEAVLILGGAGGVGSIAIQLVKQLTGLKVIASASREETQNWCKDMGADHVIDHTKDMVEQIKEIGLPVPYIFSTNATDQHWEAICQVVEPQGHICLIDDPDMIDFRMLKQKAATLSWEFMFTRSMFQTADIAEQQSLLNDVSQLVEEGRIQSTSSASFGTINAENMKKAHIAIETGRTKGKIVLAGF